MRRERFGRIVGKRLAAVILGGCLAAGMTAKAGAADGKSLWIHTDPGCPAAVLEEETDAEAYAVGKEEKKEKSDPAGDLELYARSAVLMDADSGRILVEKEGDKVLPMASTTKIMTCIIALEQGANDKVYRVSSYAAGMPKVKLGASAGEEYYGKDLLYSLMLESHNDSAVILAEGISGSVEAFAEQMNEKAEEIGCEDTHFVTPNGLDADGHYTTAADLARIMRYCIRESPEKEAFLKITQTRSYTFTDVGGKRSVSCRNHNAFLDMMEGVLSGKTGFTGKAGYCYVGALRQDGKTLIVALLACGWPNNKTYKWKDTRTLMTYGLAHYEIRKVWKEVSTDSVLVLEGLPESGELTDKAMAETRLDASEEQKEYAMLLSPEEEVEVRVQVAKTIHAPVEEGTCVGNVEYWLDDKRILQIPVVTAESVQKADFEWCLKRVLTMFFGG